MDEKLKEAISALMDDEANDIEMQRVLSKSDPDALLDTWKRYHLARDLMAGMNEVSRGIDVTASVAAEIRGESVEQGGSKGREISGTPDSLEKTAGAGRFFKYGSAVAACLVVAFGISTQNFSSLDGVTSGGEDELVVNKLDAAQRQQFTEYLLRHSELSAVTVSSGMAPLIRVASVNSIGI